MFTCIIVGAGHRAVGYAVACPDRMKVVGVADPSPVRRKITAKRFGLEPSACFESAEALAVQPKLADFIINGTMDHQSVLVDFEDGCTATLNMVDGCSKPSRSMHLIGTRGEMQGCLEESKFTIRKIDPRPGHEYAEEIVDLNVGGDMTGAHGGHGGGDGRLVSDFLDYIGGQQPSLSTTSIEDSVAGHLIGFCADRSLVESRIININMKMQLAAIAEREF